MDKIDIQKEYSFFNISYYISFVSLEPVGVATLPVNVILQLEPSSLITLKDLEIAKEKAIGRLISNLGKEDTNTFTDSCKIISVCPVAISFLGQGTEKDFLAEAK